MEWCFKAFFFYYKNFNEASDSVIKIYRYPQVTTNSDENNKIIADMRVLTYDSLTRIWFGVSHLPSGVKNNSTFLENSAVWYSSRPLISTQTFVN